MEEKTTVYNDMIITDITHLSSLNRGVLQSPSLLLVLLFFVYGKIFAIIKS